MDSSKLRGAPRRCAASTARMASAVPSAH
jgi:hypothetical protein